MWLLNFFKGKGKEKAEEEPDSEFSMLILSSEQAEEQVYLQKLKKTSDPMVHFPSEISILILSFLHVSTLGEISTVCRHWAELAADDVLWRMKILEEFSPHSYERFRANHPDISVKALYHLLVSYQEDTYTRLDTYDKKLRQNSLQDPTSSYPPHPTYDTRWGTFQGFTEQLSGQEYTSDLGLYNGSELLRHENYCKLLAASASGNTKLLRLLIRENPPELEQIFNINAWRDSQLNLKIFQHSIDKFPLPVRHITRFGYAENTSLVYFPYLHGGQQSILDFYFALVSTQTSAEEQLHYAVLFNQSEKTILKIIKAKPKTLETFLSYTHENREIQMSPLHWAVLFGNEPLVRLLIDQEVKLTEPQILLNMALMQNNKKIIGLIYKLLEQPQKPIRKELGLAILAGADETIKEHLQLNLIPEPEWSTALHLAIWHNQSSLIHIIMDKFPTLSALSDYHGYLYYLLYTSFLDNHEIRARLLAIKNNFNTQPGTQPLLHTLVKFALQCDMPDLLCAGLYTGMDITIKDRYQQTVLDIAQAVPHECKNREVVINILQCEENIQKALKSSNKSQKNPSHCLTIFSPTPLKFEDYLNMAALIDPEFFKIRIQKLLANASTPLDPAIFKKISLWWQNYCSPPEELLDLDSPNLV